MNELEYDFFIGLRNEVGEYVEEIRNVFCVVAVIDILCGLVEVVIY